MNNLAKKLRIVAESRVVCLGAPESFAVLLDPLPEGATLSTRGSGKFDVVILFATDSKALEKGFSKATTALGEDGVLWVAYPKKTSGIKTDLTRDVGWKVVVDAGFGAVTQVAIDETWSALRFKVEATIERKANSAVAPNAEKKTAPAKKAAPTPPADLMAAVVVSEAAQRTWSALAPSHVKEYVGWIEDAKKPETRARRIEQAITMLAAGVKDRNAKYAGR